MSSQPSNPKTSLKKAPLGVLSEDHLPALKRLVVGLEPACAANLPDDFKGLASTRLLALLNLASRGLAPSSLRGGAALLLELLHQRFYHPLKTNKKTGEGRLPGSDQQSARAPLRADTTALAASCCAFLSPLENISPDQCRLILQALELHLSRSIKPAAKKKSSSAAGPLLLFLLAQDSLTAGWAHEYLTEKQNNCLLARTQFFTPNWIAAYLCVEAIGGARSFTMLDPACGAGHLLVQAVYAATQDYHLHTTKDGLAQRLYELYDQQLYGLDLDADLIDLARFALYIRARDTLGESNTEDCYAEKTYAEKSDADESLAEKTYARETNARETYARETYAKENPAEETNFTDLPSPKLFCLPGPLGSLALAEGRPLRDDQGAPLPLPKKFDAVVMNPPYLSTRTMDDTTAVFLKRNFPEASGDLYTAFIQLAISLLAPQGRLSTIVQQSFLSISRYRSLRLDLLSKSRIISCVQLGTGAFPSRPGEKVNNAIITLEKPGTASATSSTSRLPHSAKEGKEQEEKEEVEKEERKRRSGRPSKNR